MTGGEGLDDSQQDQLQHGPLAVRKQLRQHVQSGLRDGGCRGSSSCGWPRGSRSGGLLCPRGTVAVDGVAGTAAGQGDASQLQRGGGGGRGDFVARFSHGHSVDLARRQSVQFRAGLVGGQPQGNRVLHRLLTFQGDLEEEG